MRLLHFIPCTTVIAFPDVPADPCEPILVGGEVEHLLVARSQDPLRVTLEKMLESRCTREVLGDRIWLEVRAIPGLIGHPDHGIEKSHPPLIAPHDSLVEELEEKI